MLGQHMLKGYMTPSCIVLVPGYAPAYMTYTYNLLIIDISDWGIYPQRVKMSTYEAMLIQMLILYKIVVEYVSHLVRCRMQTSQFCKLKNVTSRCLLWYRNCLYFSNIHILCQSRYRTLRNGTFQKHLQVCQQLLFVHCMCTKIDVQTKVNKFLRCFLKTLERFICYAFMQMLSANLACVLTVCFLSKRLCNRFITIL